MSAMLQFLLKYPGRVVAGLALLAVLLFGLSYLTGYRFGNGLSIVKSGVITVRATEAGTKVYLDTSKRKITTEENETVRFSYLKPGGHLVIAAKDGYYPWTKAVQVGEGGMAELRPFLVPMNPSGFLITEADPEYEKIQSIIDGNVLPTKGRPKTSADGLVSVWFEGSGIRALWLGEEAGIPLSFCTAEGCNRTIEGVTLSETPRNIDFYPGRNDVLLVASSDDLFAVDLDRNGLQNFQPIYKGAAPRFGVSEAGALFVHDGTTLMEVQL